ncbi:hypothetical protein SS50377_27270 [Spironucleus salmonicida]|uniref:Uncharacterized protein n=1 Tax=Spironucleus salmonicida TaxID=348837 RepID=A0A9P8LMZ0_9EUKA|nr:hypothetical protein SS50377_27270 [Spironucleus salmonicida]
MGSGVQMLEAKAINQITYKPSSTEIIYMSPLMITNMTYSSSCATINGSVLRSSLVSLDLEDDQQSEIYNF